MPARILVLEDDDDLRAELVEALVDEGHQVFGAAAGVEAVRLASEQTFELVVTDVRMGGMDGLQALARLKDECPDLISLVISGYSSEDETLRAIRLGVGEFLKKPFPLEVFLAAVERLLAVHRERRLARQREVEQHAAAVWALEALARALESAGSLGASRLAARLAQEMGLDGSLAGDLRQATLIAGLGPRSHFVLEELPPRLRQLVDRLHEPEEEPALVDKLGLVALGKRPAAEFQVQLDLAQEPGRADPQSLELGRRRRQLLALGRTLAETSQAEGAHQAYREVVELGPSREAVEALLGLARLAPESWLEKALEASRGQGPLCQASTHLQAGVWLAQQPGRAPQATPLLEQAERMHQALGLPGGMAQARLALLGLAGGPWSPVWDRCLQVLGEDERLEAWMVPLLLPHPEAEPALADLARQAPEAVLAAARRGEKLRAVQALVAAGGHGRRLVREFVSDPDPAVRSLAAAAAADGGRAAPLLRLYSLGPFEVYVGETRLADNAWKSQKVRYLVAWLASQARPLSEDRLIDELWADLPLDKARQNVYSATSAVRRALKLEGVDPILRTPDGLQLNPELGRWHDYDQLCSCLERAEREWAEGREEAGGERARQALQLYRGPYLDGCYMDWALKIRDRLEAQMVEAARRLGRWAEGQGRLAEALECAQRVLEIDPCCQQAHLLAMSAHLGQGRPEAALRQYEVCTKVLARELGMEPAISILEARQRALLSL